MGESLEPLAPEIVSIITTELQEGDLAFKWRADPLLPRMMRYAALIDADDEQALRRAQSIQIRVTELLAGSPKPIESFFGLVSWRDSVTKTRVVVEWGREALAQARRVGSGHLCHLKLTARDKPTDDGGGLSRRGRPPDEGPKSPSTRLPRSPLSGGAARKLEEEKDDD